MATRQENIDAVKKHAKENYNRDGWDTIVECWGDAEIAEQLSGEMTNEEAIAAITFFARLYREQRDNVMCQSGEHEICPDCGNWYYVERPCDCKKS